MIYIIQHEIQEECSSHIKNTTTGWELYCVVYVEGKVYYCYCCIGGWCVATGHFVFRLTMSLSLDRFFSRRKTVSSQPQTGFWWHMQSGQFAGPQLGYQCQYSPCKVKQQRIQEASRGAGPTGSRPHGEQTPSTKKKPYITQWCQKYKREEVK